MNTASVSPGGDVLLVLQQIQQSCQYGRDADVELTQSGFNAGQALAVYAARGHRPYIHVHDETTGNGTYLQR